VSDLRPFALPDVGEGLTEAEILRWHVRPGDAVAINQIIVEIETAKASVELPCPYAGTVEELHVAEGAIVPVGAPIISIRVAERTAAAERQSVLVGYGVREDVPVTRRARRGAPAVAAEPPIVATPATPATQGRAQAKPLVRKLARDLGVDLSTVTASGAHGEVTRADVMGAGGADREPAAEPSALGGERIAVRGVQRAMADAMVQSAFTAPHVTEWVDVDMRRAMDVLEQLRQQPACAGVRMSPMILVAAGLVRAAGEQPLINSTWVDDADGAHVHIHDAVHLGIAADTPRGLLVPTIKEASSLGVIALARCVQELIDTARSGRSTPADLTGGTITLTNIGVFGIDGGTPILNPGQTAILAMGRIVDRPWAIDGEVVVRPVMQLTLSFDHRVIDGATGSRALRSIADFLTDPALALMMDAAASEG
jgi:pyruvate dehydrogenase E2 component (dihydrolipoamide acetyltransferase)